MRTEPPGREIRTRRIGRIRPKPSNHVDAGSTAPPPGLKTFALLVVFYTAVAVVATWPFALSFATHLPANGDPSQHLWIMRWHKSCFWQWRLPFFCPGLQHPIGAPFGNFSPLHIQSFLYIMISSFIENDVLCYNMIWLFGLVSTGVCTFVAGWCLTRDRASATFAGLLGMLGGPVMLHAHAHLELHFLGAFSLFLIAWPRFLDRPSGRGLAASAALYVVMTSCAAYLVVLAAVPAIWAVFWQATRGGWSGLVPWFRERFVWLAGFAALSLPGLLILLSSQIWSMTHGFTMSRSISEFEQFGSALWCYAVPTLMHPLGRVLPFDAYAAAGCTGERGYWVIEKSSYLGIVTLGLLLYTAVCRVRFKRAGLWWSTLALLVILSLGAHLQWGSSQVSLPSLWLWRATPVFRLIRSPARFNLLAAIVAAVVASVGFRHLLARVRGPVAGKVLWAFLATLAIADLSLVPYVPTFRFPTMPESYTWLKARDPGATLLELPLGASAQRTYWQSLHGLTTSEGYTGVTNLKYAERIILLSPYAPWRPGFMQGPELKNFGPISSVTFRDYSWLFLTANNYQYLLVHREEGPALGDPTSLARLRAELDKAKVFENDSDTIYDRARLATPNRPVMVCTEGWRTSVTVPGPLRFGVDKVARLAVYNPNRDAKLALTIEGSAVRVARIVRVISGKTELARWRVLPGLARTYESPRFVLPEGLLDLTLESDGEDRPRRLETFDAKQTPFSLQIDSLRLEVAERPDGNPPGGTVSGRNVVN